MICRVEDDKAVVTIELKGDSLAHPNLSELGDSLAHPNLSELGDLIQYAVRGCGYSIALSDNLFGNGEFYEV